MSSQWFQEVGPEIRRIWTETPGPASFFSKMKVVTHAYRRFCKNKVVAFRAAHEKTKQELAAATGAMQSNLLDPALSARRSSLRTALEIQQTQKIAGRRVRSRVRWRAHGDLVSKEFFASVRERH